MRKAFKHALMIFNGKAPIVHQHDRCYAVPSETEGGLYYEVDLALPTCTHPHWVQDKPICKHIEAARLQEAAEKRGADTLESVPNPYKNAWYYDAVSEIEERCVYEMLRCLGAQNEYNLADVYKNNCKKNRRRPPVSIGDLLVLGGIQAYRAKPSRKAFCDHDKYLQRPQMRASTVRNRLGSYGLKQAVQGAFQQTVECVRERVRDIGVDSMFLKSPNSEIRRKGKDVVLASRIAKVNWFIDLDTFVCLVADVATNEDENDQILFDRGWKKMKGFTINRVFGDPGYDAARHFEDVAEAGGTAYILIKDHENAHSQAGRPHFNKMLKMQKERYWEEFHPNYRYRQLVESGIHAFKSIKCEVFGRLRETIENEVMLMLLVHNLRMLLYARYEYRIDIPFADQRALALIDSVMNRRAARLARKAASVQVRAVQKARKVVRQANGTARKAKIATAAGNAKALPVTRRVRKKAA